MTVTEAFEKFSKKISRPTQKEQDDASNRQNDIRSKMEEKFKKETSFLTGSYKRWTKTKPLKDVDIFYVLHADERANYEFEPDQLLNDVRDHLVKKYPDKTVKKQRRSISIEFPTTAEEQVMSFDVVPVFTKGDNYKMPDTTVSGGWTDTNPKIHEEKALAKHRACDNNWRKLVRMIKTWNVAHSKPVKPSFLLEVMALELLLEPFGGDLRREIQGYFASAALRIHDVWPDPAELGSPVSDGMDAAGKNAAQKALEEADLKCAAAIRLESQGKTGDALRIWQEVFGSQFPIS